MSSIWQDLARAWRRLATAPAFTLFCVLTLALGIGTTTAIYSVIYTALLRPLNVPDMERVVNIYHSDPFGSGPISQPAQLSQQMSTRPVSALPNARRYRPHA